MDAKNAGNLTAAADGLFFTADDGIHGFELWKTDGTATWMVADINPGPSDSFPTSLVNIDGVILFSANDGEVGSELWRSDGREAGTYRIQDINVGIGSSRPANFTRSGDLVYFTADDGVHGNELWAMPLSAIRNRQISPVQPPVIAPIVVPPR